MKKLPKVIILFLIICAIDVEAQEYDLFYKKQFVASKKIKFAIGWSYDLKQGTEEIKLPGHKSSFRKFEADGRILENVNYSLGGEAIKEEIYFYDEKQNVNRVVKYENHKSINQLYHYKYTSVGSIAEVLIVKPDKSFEKKLYKYDGKYNLIEFHLYDADFGVSKFYYGYDNYKNLVLITEMNSFGDLYEKTTLKYNDKQELIEYSATDPSGQIQYKYAYTYNDDGTLQWQTSYGVNGSPLQITKFSYEFYK